MNLSELIFKRLSADENLQTMLATYAGAPAIFDSEFPADQQEGWEGATQYPRLPYRYAGQSGTIIGGNLVCCNVYG